MGKQIVYKKYYFFTSSFSEKKKEKKVSTTNFNLKKKLANVFIQGFNQGCDKIIYIFDDVPGIKTKLITQSFQTLSNFDAVIGKTTNGG